MWRASVITLFPEQFPGILSTSLIGKALDADQWALEAHDLRAFGRGRHRTVDDTPAGGGPGMVLRADVVADAVDAVRAPNDPRPLIYLSPRGRPLDQTLVRSLAEGPGLVALCGRFEGIDERVLEARPFIEVSLGDFVLAGGEVAAMALIEACVRLLPGVMGAAASAEEESFEAGLLEYPHYTKPADWEGRVIPPVLLSGDHGKVAAWRREVAERLTAERRPDLLERGTKTAQSAVDKADGLE